MGEQHRRYADEHPFSGTSHIWGGVAGMNCSGADGGLCFFTAYTGASSVASFYVNTGSGYVLETALSPIHIFNGQSVTVNSSAGLGITTKIANGAGFQTVQGSKRFVCLCHEVLSGLRFAICLKATSQVAIYHNYPGMMAGVVYYKAKELPFFESDTAIRPDNLHPIQHGDIATCEKAGSFALLGQMPSDFRERLLLAVNSSITLAPARRKSLLSKI